MFKKTSKKIWDLVGQHLEYVYECYCAFEQFMVKLLEEGVPAHELAADYERIDALESQADSARRNLVNAFLEGSLLPSTRKELMDITAGMDKVANRCENLACQIVFQCVDIPPQFRAGLLEITRHTREQYGAMKRALKTLFDDYELLIKDPSLLESIKKWESKIDDIENSMVAALFSDPTLDLAERHHLRYFFTRLCDISDQLEDVADQLQIIVVLRKV